MTFPRVGDVLHVTRAASVQFCNPILFRVIRVHHEWTTYEGWIWLDGYQLGITGDAVERRSIFVQVRGLSSTADAWSFATVSCCAPGAAPSRTSRCSPQWD